MFRTLSKTARATLIACAAMLPASVGHATTFDGAFWDADRDFATIDEALGYIDGRAADATFQSTAIDYPTAGKRIESSTSLSDFLGATDGASVTGAATGNLVQSVFQFTGTVDLAGIQKIKVGSDDGFQLALNGVVVLEHATPRVFRYTKGSYDFTGETTFVLTYYENFGRTGVEFQIGGEVVNASMSPAPVPLPAALPMLGAGVAAMAGLRRMRRS